jgi:hypothetical protein
LWATPLAALLPVSGSSQLPATATCRRRARSWSTTLALPDTPHLAAATHRCTMLLRKVTMRYGYFFFEEASALELIGIQIRFSLVCCFNVQIVSLLLESGVEINLRNYRGQVS